MTEREERPSNRPHIALPRDGRVPYPRKGQLGFDGPSIGSVALDTRLGGRVGFVHVVTSGVVWLREPGAFERVRGCPVDAVGPPPAKSAEARSLDAPLYQEGG